MTTEINNSPYSVIDGELYIGAEKMPPEMTITMTAAILAGHLMGACKYGMAVAQAGQKRRHVERDELGRITGFVEDPGFGR